MLKIISSKLASRKAIKAQLQKEIPQINAALEKAISNGEIRIYYTGTISKPTFKMLKKAGYIVENWDIVDLDTEITWYHKYNEISENDSELEKIAKDIALEIVDFH